MGICVRHDAQDSSVVWLVVQGKWTWRDYRQAINEVYAIVEKVTHRVDVIVDLSEAASTPLESDNQALRDTFEKAPVNYGLMVFVDCDHFTQMIIAIMQKYIPVLQRKIILTDSLANAQSIINIQRAIAQRKQPVSAPLRPYP